MPARFFVPSPCSFGLFFLAGSFAQEKGLCPGFVVPGLCFLAGPVRFPCLCCLPERQKDRSADKYGTGKQARIRSEYGLNATGLGWHGPGCQCFQGLQGLRVVPFRVVVCPVSPVPEGLCGSRKQQESGAFCRSRFRVRLKQGQKAVPGGPREAEEMVFCTDESRCIHLHLTCQVKISIQRKNFSEGTLFPASPRKRTTNIPGQVPDPGGSALSGRGRPLP